MRCILRFLVCLTVLKDVFATDDLQVPYAPIEPYKIHNMIMGDIREIRFEESGNPKGILVFFVYNSETGPYSDDITYFDPAFYRIFLFNQSEIQDLPSDMKRIRTYFNIKRWMLFSKSEDIGLTLQYKEEYPEYTSEVDFRGFNLNSRAGLIKATQRFKRNYQDMIKEIESHWQGKKACFKMDLKSP